MTAHPSVFAKASACGRTGPRAPAGRSELDLVFDPFVASDEGGEVFVARFLLEADAAERSAVLSTVQLGGLGAAVNWVRARRAAP